MKPTTVFLTHIPPAARESAATAARATFPHADIVSADSVADALEKSAIGRQLLILGNPSESEVGQAVQALDDAEMPRWAVVTLGGAPSDVAEVVPPEEWSAATLGRAFRSALLQHDLLRENLRLRGDIKTVARRISHDIRTPLGCIHTMCELLKEVPPENTESLREMASVIRNATGEVGHLIDRVSFALRASIEPTPPGPVCMGAVVDSALNLLCNDLRAAGRTVEQPPEWPSVDGVPAWLEVIWWNLVDNALRHGDSSAPIRIGWARDGESFRFFVSSKGKVPAAQLPRLLRRFDLLHSQTSSGLGLSLVERLVALQNGSCGYENTRDGCSVFYFRLPATPGALDPVEEEELVFPAAKH